MDPILYFKSLIHVNHRIRRILRLQTDRASKICGSFFFGDSSHNENEFRIEAKCERVWNLRWHLDLTKRSPNMQLRIIPFYWVSHFILLNVQSPEKIYVLLAAFARTGIEPSSVHRFQLLPTRCVQIKPFNLAKNLVFMVEPANHIEVSFLLLVLFWFIQTCGEILATYLHILQTVYSSPLVYWETAGTRLTV